jgi:hypothetical protein
LIVGAIRSSGTDVDVLECYAPRKQQEQGSPVL